MKGKTYLLHFFYLLLQFLDLSSKHFLFNENIRIVLSFHRVSLLISKHLFIGNIHPTFFWLDIKNSCFGTVLVVFVAVSKRRIIEFGLYFVFKLAIYYRSFHISIFEFFSIIWVIILMRRYSSIINAFAILLRADLLFISGEKALWSFGASCISS